MHSEVHAVVDAIHHYGEDECFNKLFPQATIMIVELHSDYAYDTCHRKKPINVIRYELCHMNM